MDKSAFETHPIWGTLTALETALAKASERREPGADGQLGRLQYLAARVRSHANPTDYAPYSATALSAVHPQLNQVLNEVNNFSSNGNVGHLNNAETYADQALYSLGMWPAAILRGGAAKQASRVFAEYREAAESALASLRQANNELHAEFESQRSKSEAAVETLKAQIAALSTKVTEDEARLDTALTTTNEAFTTKQTEREEKFKEFVEKQGEALKVIASEDLDAISDLVADANAAYAQIDGLREGVEKVAGLASADILAGKFKEYSDQQWKWGLWMNALGFLALSAGLAVIVWTLHAIGRNETVSWQYTSLKLGVTVTIVAASAVAFRLGALFLSRSSTSKRMELELRAIGPFFADIDDREAVKAAKQAFVERSFGRSWDAKRDQGAGGRPDEASSAVVKELIELVKVVTSRS